MAFIVGPSPRRSSRTILCHRHDAFDCFPAACPTHHNLLTQCPPLLPLCIQRRHPASNIRESMAEKSDDALDADRKQQSPSSRRYVGKPRFIENLNSQRPIGIETEFGVFSTIVHRAQAFYSEFRLRERPIILRSVDRKLTS
jgi:hypothetical protein